MPDHTCRCSAIAWIVRRAFALVLATLVTSSASAAEGVPGNTNRCDDLRARAKKAISSEQAIERLDIAQLACRLDAKLGAAEAERMLGAQDATLRVRGDEVVFLARAKARAVQMTGTLSVPMERIGATDLWVARYRFFFIQGAMLRFMPMADGRLLPSVAPVKWRGPKALPQPYAKPKLTGIVLERTLWSKALQETRKLRIYLPPRYDAGRKYPALYMGDGDVIEVWASYVEPLIDAGKIPPLVIVAAESGQAGIVEDRASLGVELRSADYLPDFKNAGDRFDCHMRFFTQELIAYAEREFALAPDRTKRAILGQSNGAVFAREAALRHGDLFGTALAFSMGWTQPQHFGQPGAPRARFAFGAGLYEAGFYLSTRKTAELLRKRGFDVAEEYAYAGHDPDMWAMFLVHHLWRAFGTRPSQLQSASPAVPRYDRTLLLEPTSETSGNVGIGDFNNDGNLDLVLAKGRHWPLLDRILLGDGHGRFDKAYDLGKAPDRSYSANVADMDADGDLDIVVGNDAPDPKRIYLNNGKGRFDKRTFGQPEWQTRNTTVADIDRDGRNDILVANRGGAPSQLCLNEGRGRFLNCFAVAAEPATRITPSEFNGDERIDLVVPHRDGGQSYVYLNPGNTRYSPAARIPFGPPDAHIRMCFTADLDKDGARDIVAIDERTGVAVYFGNKAGGFSEGVTIAGAKPAPYALLVRDLNGDEWADIIVGHVEAPSTIYVNDHSGRRYTPHHFGDGKGTVYGFAIADLDNDGFLDIAAARSEAPNVVYFGASGP